MKKWLLGTVGAMAAALSLWLGLVALAQAEQIGAVDTVFNG